MQSQVSAHICSHPSRGKGDREREREGERDRVVGVGVLTLLLLLVLLLGQLVLVPQMLWSVHGNNGNVWMISKVKRF